MDGLTQLVNDALRRSAAESQATGVINTVANRNRYVQWLWFEDGAMHVEISNPESQRPKKSLVGRIFGRHDRETIEPDTGFTEQQLAALTQLGFTTGSPNYERDILAGQVTYDELVELLTAALRRILGVTNSSHVTVDVF